MSHPNLLCLRDTFDEVDGVYLVLELAPEGELFNLIVMKQKLTEEETRRVFVQLFQGVRYLVRLLTAHVRRISDLSQHERNIVHRDIKPENILLADKELSVKIADFGLAKIIGEESFTSTLWVLCKQSAATNSKLISLQVWNTKLWVPSHSIIIGRS